MREANLVRYSEFLMHFWLKIPKRKDPTMPPIKTSKNNKIVLRVKLIEFSKLFGTKAEQSPENLLSYLSELIISSVTPSRALIYPMAPPKSFKQFSFIQKKIFVKKLPIVNIKTMHAKFLQTLQMLAAKFFGAFPVRISSALLELKLFLHI